MNIEENKSFIQQWLFLIGACCAWHLYNSLHHRNIWFFAAGIVGFLVLVSLFFFAYWNFNKPVALRTKVSSKFLRILFIGLAILFSVCFFAIQGKMFIYSAWRLMIAVVIAGLGALFCKASDPKRSVYLDFGLFLLIFGALHRGFAFLNEIQTSPFSLGWSEGSRYYNASLFASNSVYGIKLPWPVLHPSRYLLQAIPFFFGIRSILIHRIWQVMLWLGLTTWAAWVLVKRVQPGLRQPKWVLTILFALFFFQGAVYYHLMVCLLLVLYTYNQEKPWKTLFFVVLASVWAGISRVNWMPFPSLLAVLLYLLEAPFDGKAWFKYLRFPILWAVAGTGVAFLSKTAYKHLSGEAVNQFDSAFSSALLWDRLFPNATFFLGILPAILLVCLPGIVLVVQKIKNEKTKLHWLRWVGIGAILTVFFLGGIVVSVKIGGGGDLHNLDAFLVLWLLFVSIVIAGNLKPDNLVAEKTVFESKAFWLAVAVIIPVFFSFLRGGSWHFKTDVTQRSDLAQLKHDLGELKNTQGSVLFISERQLLSFGEIVDLELVHDYEKVILMEMAMGNNEDYLKPFYTKLKNHEFKGIVIDSVSARMQDRSHAFNEENNAWVDKVLLPILMFYELKSSYRNGEVNLLVPIHNTSFEDL